MSIAVTEIEPGLLYIQVTEDEILAHLVDGRTISVPLAWSWRLSEATPNERQNLEIIGDGQGIHWPDIDEDISAAVRLEKVSSTYSLFYLAILGEHRSVGLDSKDL